MHKDSQQGFETLKTESSRAPALGLSKLYKPFILCSWEVKDSTRSPDPKTGNRSETSALLFKTTGLSGPETAKLPAGSSSHSPVMRLPSSRLYIVTLLI